MIHTNNLLQRIARLLQESVGFIDKLLSDLIDIDSASKNSPCQLKYNCTVLRFAV